MNGGDDGYDKLIETACAGISKIDRMGIDEQREWLKSQKTLPPMLPMKGNAGVRLITKEGMSALRELGRLWHRNNPNMDAIASSDAAADKAVEVFGELLADANSLPDDTDIKSELLERMTERVHADALSEQFYFPARVFEQEDVESFSIGPVKFLRRLDWLTHVSEVGRYTPSWAEDVRLIWSGQTDTQKVPAGGPEKDITRDADEILKIVGQAEWIVAVLIEGRDRSRSEVCASAAARVAIDALGLRTHERLARNLRGPGQVVDGSVQRGFSQIVGRGMSMSVSFDFPQIGGPPGAQADYLHNVRKLLNAAGVALSAFVDVSGDSQASGLKRRWVEAMYWFGQARREKDDFISLVKVGIALDVLTQGAKSKGIRQLASSLLRMSDRDQYCSDGRSLKTIVDNIYEKGRSMIAHGGRLA